MAILKIKNPEADLICLWVFCLRHFLQEYSIEFHKGLVVMTQSYPSTENLPHRPECEQLPAVICNGLFPRKRTIEKRRLLL